ncbi:hypothetical protein C8J57DRAFT_1546237 [Mycena rebaudengoi]|nr:hypothetical protein C8J57DRAFT_1546237 [Mycena rebaudengoi]
MLTLLLSLVLLLVPAVCAEPPHQRADDSNANNVDDGFFQSRYLVKSYKICFTVPKSAKDDIENEPAHKKAKRIAARAVRKPPAEILLMIGKPYYIIYLHVCYGFSYPQMYNFIVDYFESPREGTPYRAHVDKFLSWCNQQIFTAHASSASTASTSVNSMFKLRARPQRRTELEA